MAENEVWKDVVGYVGLYKVSDRGNVSSIVRKDSIGRKCGGIILRPIPDANGYIRVSLCKNGKVKKKLIHRLVLEAFVENPNNLPEVNHLDENKANNELSNLEWCDIRYNSNYGTRNERSAQARSKRVKAVNVETGEVLTFSSITEAGRKGYSRGRVSEACRGAYRSGNGKLIGGNGRTYKGFKWYYMEENR